MAKVLLFLHTPEPGSLLGVLPDRMDSLVTPLDHVTVQLMREPAQDFFHDPEGLFSRPQIVVEAVTAPGLPLSTLRQALGDLLSGISVDSASTAFVMQARWFIPAPPQPLYYHHFLLRRPEFTVADYNDYYSNYHCSMGFHTPGIAGYVQNYIDQVASEALAAQLGLACREVTSISELSMASMEAFIGAPALSDVAQAAAQDEARFIQRDQSLFFCSEVVCRVGDFDRIGAAVFPQSYPQGETD